MRNALIFVLGLFSALAVAWSGIVLGSHAQLGELTPYFDEMEGQTFPPRMSGVAARGQFVYADLGCASCHTQQVRRPDFGSDKDRGWGERQSVARDYLFQYRPQLGAMRIGPDLANLAARRPQPPTTEDLLKLLYLGSPTHPSYKFLFDRRQIVGERSAAALNLTGRDAPRPGYQVVPTERAALLVSYLLSLDQSYEFPEARPVEPAPETETAPAAAGQPEVTPVPAAPADERHRKGDAK
jgi:cytochrome c oxidase cbb3-type subunit II